MLGNVVPLFQNLAFTSIDFSPHTIALKCVVCTNHVGIKDEYKSCSIKAKILHHQKQLEFNHFKFLVCFVGLPLEVFIIFRFLLVIFLISAKSIFK